MSPSAFFLFFLLLACLKNVFFRTENVLISADFMTAKGELLQTFIIVFFFFFFFLWFLISSICTVCSVMAHLSTCDVVFFR